jgi:hypothetical protein
VPPNIYEQARNDFAPWLKESRSLFGGRAATASAPGGVPSGLPIAASRRTTALSGAGDAVHPDDREATLAAWGEAERSGSFSADYRVCRAADGIYRWFQGRGVPVRDGKGRIIEWLGTATDIDDQVRAREVLARGHEELEKLVAARTSDLAQALESLRAEAAERGQAEEACVRARRWRRLVC